MASSSGSVLHNTEHRLSCLLSRFVVVLLMLTAFCSHIDSVFSERTPYILNTLAGEIWCVCSQIGFLLYCILTLLLSIFVSYLSKIAWWQIAAQPREDGSHQLSSAVNSTYCTFEDPLKAWPQVKIRRIAPTFEKKKSSISCLFCLCFRTRQTILFHFYICVYSVY